MRKPWKWIALIPMALGPATPFVLAALLGAFVAGAFIF